MTDERPIEFEESSGNVFEDIGFDKSTARRLAHKADLVGVLHRGQQELGLTQVAFARLVGIPQPRLSKLYQGKIADMSTDKLLDAIDKLGRHTTINVERSPISGESPLAAAVGENRDSYSANERTSGTKVVDHDAIMKSRRDELLMHQKTGTLLNAIFDEYSDRSSEDNSELIALVASLHNDGLIDVISPLTDTNLERFSGYRFFGGQTFYCDLIPKLHCDARSLMRAVDALVRTGGNDMASNLPNSAFLEWCAADQKRPAEVLRLVENGNSLARDHLTFALQAGARLAAEEYVDKAIEYLSSSDDALRLPAIAALGRMKQLDRTLAERTLSALEAALNAGGSDLLRHNILVAAFGRLELADPENAPDIAPLVAKTVSQIGPQVIHGCANMLAFHGKRIPPDIVDLLIKPLEDVDPDNRGTIDRLDMGLVRLAELGEYERARRLLETILLAHKEINLTSFDSFLHKLVQPDNSALGRWVVAWFQEGQFRLCKELSDSIRSVAHKPIHLRIDFAELNIPTAQRPYLARKAVGFFFLQAPTAVSFIISLLRDTEGEAAAEIEALLLDPLLISYSGVAKDYLKPIAEDEADDASAAAKRALAALESYLDGLRAVGTIPEMRPSEHERQLERQRHHDAMSHAHREAQKKSILQLIAKQSVLLYGTRTISYAHLRGDAPQRMEMKLSSFETTFEYPRLDIVDPTGLQHQLFLFRAERPVA